MKRLRLFALVLLVGLSLAIPGTHLSPAAASAGESEKEKKEVKVWVNTNSGVYHCPGTRWYGNTKRGKYMGECAAIKDWNRAAYGNGSDCK
jgi:hypothetical protein